MSTHDLHNKKHICVSDCVCKKSHYVLMSLHYLLFDLFTYIKLCRLRILQRIERRQRISIVYYWNIPFKTLDPLNGFLPFGHFRA